MRRFTLFLSLFFFFLLTNHSNLRALESNSYDLVTIHHSQDRVSLKEQIIHSIAQAKHSILILTFTLSDPDVLSLIQQKAEEGVQVKIVIDKDHRPLELAKNPSIQILTRLTGEGRIHHKILVVDESIVWIGSANFTTSAYNDQENVMTKIMSVELAQLLHQEALTFEGAVKRDAISPPAFNLNDQIIRLGLLPHDGYPKKKVEDFINRSSKELLLQTIRNAKSTIQIAMMVWTEIDLAQAIKEAHHRGVIVEIVAPDLGGVLPDLIRSGIDVRINPTLAFMHNKLMYVDHSILINGSANWSKSSFTRNDESYILIDPLTSDQQHIMDAYWSYLWLDH